MKKILICFLFISLIASGCSAKSSNLTLKGDIQNNIISATSIIPGRIIEMSKQQGEPVKKGDIIAVIDNTNQKFTVDQLQAVVNMKKAKLEELQAGARPQQIEQAEAQARAAKAQWNLLSSGNRTEQVEQGKNSVLIAKEAVASTQLTYDYVTKQYNDTLQLYNQGATSKTDLDNAKYKLDTTANSLSSAKYQLKNAEQALALLQDGSTTQAIIVAKSNYEAANAQLNLLQSGATKQTIESAQADLDQSIAQLNLAQNTLNNSNIIALDDGIIISKNFQLGDVVNVGSNIADIAIANDLYVLCYIPDKYLDKIYYNQPLKVTASTGVQTGTVSYIALKSEYTPKDLQSTTQSSHQDVKIKVSIKDSKGILKSGMTAEVEIPLK